MNLVFLGRSMVFLLLEGGVLVYEIPGYAEADDKTVEGIVGYEEWFAAAVRIVQMGQHEIETRAFEVKIEVGVNDGVSTELDTFGGVLRSKLCYRG